MDTKVSTTLPVLSCSNKMIVRDSGNHLDHHSPLGGEIRNCYKAPHNAEILESQAVSWNFSNLKSNLKRSNG